MEVTEVRKLSTGDELFVRDGVGRIIKDNVVTFLAGPFENGSGARRNWVAVVRNSDGNVKTYNLGDLAVKPPVPKIGEIWIHRVEGFGRTRYIDDVTDRYVITKSDYSKPDSKAHLMSISDFVARFKRRPE